MQSELLEEFDYVGQAQIFEQFFYLMSFMFTNWFQQVTWHYNIDVGERALRRLAVLL